MAKLTVQGGLENAIRIVNEDDDCVTDPQEVAVLALGVQQSFNQRAGTALPPQFFDPQTRGMPAAAGEDPRLRPALVALDDASLGGLYNWTFETARQLGGLNYERKAKGLELLKDQLGWAQTAMRDVIVARAVEALIQGRESLDGLYHRLDIGEQKSVHVSVLALVHQMKEDAFLALPVDAGLPVDKRPARNDRGGAIQSLPAHPALLAGSRSKP